MEEEEKVEYTVVDCFQEKFGPAVSINWSFHAVYMTLKPPCSNCQYRIVSIAMWGRRLEIISAGCSEVWVLSSNWLL